MNFEKALKILGLNQDYSDNDLKRAYRSLSKKHHPDNFMDNEAKRLENEEKMKEINSAYDYLSKLNEDIAPYKAFLAKKLLEYLEEPNNKEKTSSLYKEYYNKLIALIREYGSKLFACSDRKSVDTVFKEAISAIISLFLEFKDNYFKSYNLNYKTKLDCNCSFYAFYQKLEEIKDQEFQKIIKSEISKYELWQYYDFLKDKINNCILEYVKKAKENDYKNLSNLITDMHNDILNIFNTHAQIGQKFSQIRDYFKDLYGEEIVLEFQKGNYKKTNLSDKERDILKKLFSCLTRYSNDCNIADTFKIICDLEKIVNDIKEKNKRTKNKTQIKGLYSKVLTNYTRAMEFFNKSFNSEKMRLAMEYFNEFLGIYDLLKAGEISFNRASILENLSFQNFQDDNTLLNVVLNSGAPDFDLDIYVSKKRNHSFESRFFILESENLNSVTLLYFVGNEISRMTIPLSVWKERFISLEDYLINGTYIGAEEKMLSYLVLYQNDNEILYCDSFGDFHIDENYNFYEFDIPLNNPNYAIREFTRMKIVEWLRRKLDKAKKNKYSFNGNWVEDLKRLLSRELKH